MKKSITLFALLFSFCFSNAQIINTIAGNGSLINSGNGAPATSAGIYLPGNIYFNKLGDYYISTDVGNIVRKVTTDGIIHTVAGTGAGGFFGDGGPATAAKFKTIQFVAVDTLGNFYISDQENNRVRKVDIATGMINTIAGNSTAGFGGDGFPASSSTLNNPNGLCFDKKGNLYIADYGNSRIRKISPSGIITTFAGTGGYGYNGDEGLADTSELRGVYELCSDDTGNIYLADEGNGRIRKVDTFGIIHTIAGTGIAGYSNDGFPALSAKVEPHFVAHDRFGNTYFSDVYTHRVRVVNSAGVISTVAGTGTMGFTGEGGPANLAELNTPFGLTVDQCGNLYICDGHNYRIRKVTFAAAAPTITISTPSSAVIGTNVTVDAATGCCGADTFNWYNHGLLFATTTTPSVTYTHTSLVDSITAVVYGCGNSVTSALHVVTTDNTLVESVPNEQTMALWPNPVHASLQMATSGTGVYRVLSIQGVPVLYGTLQAGGNTIVVDKLPSGIYLFEFVGVDGVKVVRRVVKE